MRLSKIAIQNFLSFGDALCELSLNKQGLVGIVWALYGKTMRGYKGDDVANRHTEGPCVVSLDFTENGNNYRVERSRRLKGKRTTSLTLSVNGREDATRGKMDDTQELIQSIIGMDYDTFTQSVMMSQGTNSFSSMTDSAQKAVLEDILQMQQLSFAKKKVSERVSSKQNDLATIRGKIEALRAQIDVSERNLKQLREHVAHHADVIKAKREDLVRQKQDTEERIESSKPKTSEDHLLAKLEELAQQEKELRDREFQLHLEEQEKVEDFTKRREKIVRDEGALHGALSNYDENIKNYSDLAGKECPTCKQLVDPTEAEACIEAWEQKADEIRSKEVVRINKEKGILQRTERKTLQGIKDRLGNCRKELDIVRSESILVREALTKHKAAIQVSEQLQESVDRIEKEIADLDQTENPYKAPAERGAPGR